MNCSSGMAFKYPLRLSIKTTCAAPVSTASRTFPENSPGEFSGKVRDAVETGAARVVVIDSLSGYLNAMPDEQFMILQMHELLTYLNQQGVVTILVLAQSGMVGHVASPLDLTYLSDTVLLLRFFEAGGQIRRAASVIKKRTGSHENTIREFCIDSRCACRRSSGRVPWGSDWGSNV